MSSSHLFEHQAYKCWAYKHASKHSLTYNTFPNKKESVCTDQLGLKNELRLTRNQDICASLGQRYAGLLGLKSRHDW